jgi:hypothetical protein
MRPCLNAVAAVVLLVLFDPAQAGRPLFTEDADVLEPGACEWEGFTERLRESGADSVRALITQGSCGVGWRSQFGVAYGAARSAGESEYAWALGGKTALRRREGGEIGVSLAWGLAFADTPAASARFVVGTLLMVATAELAPALSGHANLGWLHRHGEGSNALSWNLALQRGLGDALELVVEVYGNTRQAPWLGVGARWNATESLSLNAGVAAQRETTRPWQWSLGFKLGF